MKFSDLMVIKAVVSTRCTRTLLGASGSSSLGAMMMLCRTDARIDPSCSSHDAELMLPSPHVHSSLERPDILELEARLMGGVTEGENNIRAHTASNSLLNFQSSFPLIFST